MKTTRQKTNYFIVLLSGAVLLLMSTMINIFAVTIDTVDVSIYAFEEEPVIDGVIEEGWNSNDFLNIEKIAEELSVETQFSEEDYLPRFKMSWFGNRLYFLFVVNDDILINPSEYAHRNDGFSINLDLGNEKSEVLDNNDHNLVAGWGKPETGFVYSGDPDLIGANLIDIVDYAETIDEENGIFIAEIGFDVTELNMPDVLQESTVFGLEVEVYDFDGHNNPGTFDRDLTAFWHSDTTISWFNRSVVGSVGLGAIKLKAARSHMGTNNLKSEKELAVYPQPATGMITIQADENLSRIEIYNPIGELVLSNIVDSGSSILDISELPAGCYLMSVYTNSEFYNTKKLVIQ